MSNQFEEFEIVFRARVVTSKSEPMKQGEIYVDLYDAIKKGHPYLLMGQSNLEIKGVKE